MPRLPVIMATEGVQVPPRPRYPRDTGGPGLQIAAEQITGGLHDFAVAERKRTEKEAHQEAGLMSADAEQRIGIADVQLRATQRDPDAYVSDYDKLVADTVGEVAKGAKNPQAAALMQQHLAQVLTKNRVAAAQHAQGLRTDMSVATLDATLDGRKTLAGLAESDTDFQRHYQEGLNAIKLATPDIGANKAGDTERAFRQSILGGRALMEANTTPEAFVETADTRYGAAGLDKKHLEELKQSARLKVESDRKNHNAEWDKFYTRVEAEAEEERKAQMVGLEQAGLKGQLTVSRLDDAKAMRIVTTREEYATLYKLATDERDAPSDKVALEDASIRAHRATPTITGEQLDALYRKGDLNRKDWKELKDKVIARGDHLKTEGQTDQGKRHQQAEQLLDRALGISTMTDKIDDQDKQLQDIGLRELTARSSAFNGKEDPLAVVTEIINRVQPLRQERLKLKVPEIGRTLRFRANDTETADMLLKDAVTRGLIIENSPEHRIEQRKILDMLRAEQALELTQAKTGKPASSAGSGGSTLGRKPGQTPQKGTAD